MGDWNQARNLLCIRLDAMGDVLMTTPAIRALKDSLPGRRITLLTSPSGVAIAKLIPEIDEVMVYDAPWMKSTALRPNSAPELDRIAQLRAAQFDAAVIFTVYSQNPLPTAFLCYLADIPLRLAHCRENPYQLLTNWVLDPEPSQGVRHEVQRQLDLVATVGSYTRDQKLSLRIPEQAYTNIRLKLHNLGLDLGRPWMVVHPGATAASRRYPPEYFAVAAHHLTHDHGIQILFTGSHPERPLIENIRCWMHGPSYSLVSELDLAELSALIAIAPLLLSNNTGPVHLAAALGTPVVDLYALTNPQHTPWQVPNRVLFKDVPCKFCYKSLCPEHHHQCLRGVSPNEVVQAVLGLLAESQQPHPEYSSIPPLPITPYVAASVNHDPSDSQTVSAQGIWR